MPIPSNYGADYSRFFTPVPGEQAWIPFPHPANDGQKVANARARAERAGVQIGSGYLDPKSGVLKNPNADHWYSDPRILGPAAVAAAGGIGALGAFGGGASGTTMIPGTGIPTVAGTGAGVTAPTTAGTIAGTTAAGTTAIKSLRDTITSPEGIANLAALIPALVATSRGGGSGSGSTDELRRIQGITETQMRRADPLHQVAVQLAFDRAPMSARRGVALQNVPLP